MNAENHETPAFAVVGRVNMGKSAVIATLLEIDDNEVVRVSATPGETTRCQPHRVAFGGREFVRFIDTPGFSRPVEAMRLIQKLHGEGTPGLESLRRFVEVAGEEFGDEKRLLEPLLEGAGILYVVDPAKPVRDDLIAEMEILRWTGRPRLALLNRREGGEGPDEEALRSRLGGWFNLVRSFDAHHARYDERLRLLKALLEIEERHRPVLEECIRMVENEWNQRREETAEVLLGFLEEAMRLRVSVTLEERDLGIPSRKARKEELLAQRYFARLAEIERECFARMLGIYRHHLLKADADPSAFVGIDLESRETWSKFGLSRAQLAAVGAAIGASAGMVLDAGTGFFSHGAGTALGAVGGGLAAWLKGGSLPDLRISLSGGVKLATGEGRSVAMGPPQNPNFPWVLLDGVLTRYRTMLARAHGRRDEEILTGDGQGFVRGFPAERRSVLEKWFAGGLKGKPARELEPEVFKALDEALREAGGV